MSEHTGALTSAANLDAPLVPEMPIWTREVASPTRADVMPEVASPARTDLLPVQFVEPAVFVGDLILVITLSVMSGVVYHWTFFNYLPPIEIFVAAGVLIFSNFSAVLLARGDYRICNLVDFRRQARDIAFIWAAVFIVVLGVAFSLKFSQSFSRGAMMGFFISGLSALIAARALLARLLAKALLRGAFAERKVIVIAEKGSANSSRALRELRRCGYRAVRTFEISDRVFGDELISASMPKTLSMTLDKVVEAARGEMIESIFLLVGWQRTRDIEGILNVLSVLPLPVQLLPDEHVSRHLSRGIARLGTIWTAELIRAPLTKPEQILKRSLDVVAATCGLILVSPIMLLIAAAIKLDSPGPVLFKQHRNGFNGRLFAIFKFRTMTVLQDGEHIRQATRNDPRVTRVGRLLRRISIDELPQLFNVLNGEMSLVGPRPHAAAHNTQYEQLIASYEFRYHVKPGITGWAQVNGFRGETPTVDLMEKRVKHDLWYINNWSIWLDLRIILQTAFTLISQPMAY